METPLVSLNPSFSFGREPSQSASNQNLISFWRIEPLGSTELAHLGGRAVFEQVVSAIDFAWGGMVTSPETSRLTPTDAVADQHDKGSASEGEAW